MPHHSVLYEEALDSLGIKADGIYIDCTFGRGGHSIGILKQLGESGKLLAFDRDIDAINSSEAEHLLSDHRFHLHHGCFTELAAVSEKLGYTGRVDGILMDLGVSSPQLDNAERGFSFLRDGPLDMRMDTTHGLSAARYLAQVEEQDLVRVLFEYGEERFARRIAKAIVERRQLQPLQTTLQLAKLIEDSVPFKDKYKHPATRTFQAIRIEINQELEQVKTALQQAIQVLAPEGRLVVIAFHSLEDRIVKRFIRGESGLKHNPGRLPVKEQDIAKGQLKKVGKSIRAKAQELQTNPRARSAIMRVAEKI
ncbi:MAG: 16S rRNA (cytosine(1402)-N(4))-methyltransferase RsmH [Methylomonas sp.]|jgi:16S rRNA (cytosine1402-N4)-methyltransferase|uniref:16S rRNA (cytosine(1402)-N(4))-methyltransferase RsmH n=1 Tax=Methylomonas sp. TaxID=418 RepID=UPI0025E876E2|nr:16S rRNA (cytosine(1402)-N(4))-methyltransferase RsmH [Methylomonas sp.]MCK9607730.1 16S rRNA (cytosine(1402)-N(4))-methyltransferase RsmH [Methylomonas sp.]